MTEIYQFASVRDNSGKPTVQGEAKRGLATNSPTLA